MKDDLRFPKPIMKRQQTPYGITVDHDVTDTKQINPDL